MTTPSPQELAATVRAGIARERQQAQAATPGPWRWDSDEFLDNPGAVCVHGSDWADHGPNLINDDDAVYAVVSATGYDASSVEIRRADAAHIAAHDPARVLADCDRAEADLTAWEAVLERHKSYAGGTWCDRCDPCYAPCPDAQRAFAALGRLAAAYGGEG